MRHLVFAAMVWLSCLGLGSSLRAQESAGQADMSFQQYYLSSGSQRISNISGLQLHFSEFIPNVGLLSGDTLPAVSNNRFRLGDDNLRLQGFPWKSQYWNFAVGDFRVPGQLVTAPFSNINFPEIAARGVLVEASHGGRSFGFFFGEETISNTPRVPLRFAVPQKLLGLYLRQKVGSRLLLGARLMRFSNDLAALNNQLGLVSQSSLIGATTLGVSSLYTVAGPLKLYGEGVWSTSTQENPSPGGRNTPFSGLAGPVFETKVLSARANYTFQSASYFPLFGYYLGDRKGPYAEVKLHPVDRLEFYGSASEYENNLSHDPSAATFRNTTQSAGVSVQIPGRVMLNANLNMLNLWSRPNGHAVWSKTADQQKMVNMSRTLAGHNVRVSVREFSDISTLHSQRQRSAEVEDSFRIRRLNLGAGVRMQRLNSTESRTSLFYRGSAQLQFRYFSAYANFETGSDLANRTLFATNTISTTVFGANLNLSKNWEFQAEAFRNNLLTELNPQSIFVLQGMGVSVPGTLAALNQWSVYFRITRRLTWGHAGVPGDVTQFTMSKAALKGTLEGFVMERTPGGDRPAEGVTVNADQARVAVTDADGRYRFPDMPEGSHKVGLSLHELPAEFDTGKNIEASVLVQPGKVARADFDVIRLAAIRGVLTAPKDTPVESIIIRMLNSDRYTTPGPDGSFTFYNLQEGTYRIGVDPKSLPQFGAVTPADAVEVTVHAGSEPEMVRFQLAVHEPQKAVRQIVLGQPAPPVAPPVPTAVTESPLAAPPAVVQPAPAAAPSTPADAQKRYQTGRQLTQAGKYQEAVAEFDEAIRIQPDSAPAYNARGYARFLLRQYREAIEDLDHAIRLNPGYADAYQIRSAARKATGDLTGAADDLKKAKELAR